MKTLYHGTSSNNLSCIKLLGLVPGHAKGGDAWAKAHHMLLAITAKLREPSVFLTDEVDNATDFAEYAVEEVGGDPIVVTVRVPGQVFDTFVVDELYDADNNGTPHAWRAHNVPAKYVGEVRHVNPGATAVQLRALEDLLAGFSR